MKPHPTVSVVRRWTLELGGTTTAVYTHYRRALASSQLRGSTKLPIIRGSRPADQFAQISNQALEDARLSYRARGLLAYMLSRPEGWTTDATRLAAGKSTEGRGAILTALKELENHGYLVRRRTQDRRGRFSTDTYVTEFPENDPDALF